MADGIRDKVAIVGMGCTRFGERWDMSSDDLIVEAYKEALDDAGIDQEQLQAAWLATCFDEINVGKSALPLSLALKLPFLPVTRVENFCASGTEAFRGAVEVWEADMLELDVRLTRDGRVVVIHDDTVDRTTEGYGRVADLTLADVQKLDAGYRFRDESGQHSFRGQGVSVPTFEEVLVSFPDVWLNVEAKEAPVAVMNWTRLIDSRCTWPQGIGSLSAAASAGSTVILQRSSGQRP